MIGMDEEIDKKIIDTDKILKILIKFFIRWNFLLKQRLK